MWGMKHITERQAVWSWTHCSTRTQLSCSRAPSGCHQHQLSLLYELLCSPSRGPPGKSLLCTLSGPSSAIYRLSSVSSAAIGTHACRHKARTQPLTLLNAATLAHTSSCAASTVSLTLHRQGKLLPAAHQRPGHYPAHEHFTLLEASLAHGLRSLCADLPASLSPITRWRLLQSPGCAEAARDLIMQLTVKGCLTSVPRTFTSSSQQARGAVPVQGGSSCAALDEQQRAKSCLGYVCHCTTGLTLKTLDRPAELLGHSSRQPWLLLHPMQHQPVMITAPTAQEASRVARVGRGAVLAAAAARAPSVAALPVRLLLLVLLMLRLPGGWRCAGVASCGHTEARGKARRSKLERAALERTWIAIAPKMWLLPLVLLRAARERARRGAVPAQQLVQACSQKCEQSCACAAVCVRDPPAKPPLIQPVRSSLIAASPSTSAPSHGSADARSSAGDRDQGHLSRSLRSTWCSQTRLSVARMLFSRTRAIRTP